jgi:hypothetical protein
MRKIMATTTIAIAAALGTAPTVAAVTVATVYHGCPRPNAFGGMTPGAECISGKGQP